MRRFLSIAICSVSLLAHAPAQTFGPISHRYDMHAAHYRRMTTNPEDGVNVSVQFGAGMNTATFGFWTGQLYLIVATNTGGNLGRHVVPVSNNTNHVSVIGANEWTVYSDNNRTNIIASGYRVGYVPLATNSFSWTFTPDYAGSVVQVKATNGTVLGTFGLPAVISSNYVLSSTIVTNASLLNGAQFLIDGALGGLLSSGVTVGTVDGFFDRPGYSLEFDSSYQTGEWQARRPDGSIAASGSAATVGTALTGRLTVAEGESAEIYTRVPAGDGMGSAWVPTGVTLQGSGTTSYTFINNTNAPAPTPMPTPGPVSSPTPGPTAPTTTTNTTPVVTNPTNTEDYVTVDVGTLELEDADDGETNVITGIGQLQGLVQGIVSDMAQTQANFMNAADELNGLRLGGVGKNCTFQFGPANIQLQTSGAVRTGLTLLVIGMAGFVAAGMLRNAVQ